MLTAGRLAARLVFALSLALPASAASVQRSPGAPRVIPAIPTTVGVPSLGAQNLPSLPSNPGAVPGLYEQFQLPQLPTSIPASAVPAADPAPGALDSVRNLSEAISPDAHGNERPTDDVQRASGAAFDGKNSPSKGVTIDGGGGNGSGGSGGNGGPPSQADDGGGPSYPHRIVKFLKEAFRSVLFRPNVPVEADLVRAIDEAEDSIHIAVYEFGLRKVMDALKRARDRGVEIHIVIDYEHVFPPPPEPGSTYKPKRSWEVWALLREGFDVKVLKGLGEFGINHNKFAVFDFGKNKKGKSLAEFGSYNWSWTAENSHYENANFTDDKERIAALKAYWDWLDSNAQTVTIKSRSSDYTWPKTVPAPPVKIAADIDFYGTMLPPVVLSPNSAPGESSEDRLVQAIEATGRIADKAKRTIDISVFALRSTRIAEALAAARKAGTKVRVIMDERQATDPESRQVFGIYAEWLAFQGVEVKTLSGPDPNSKFPMAQKDHHKFAVFAGELVETGSPNYTKYAAIGNFENAHFLQDKTDAAAYLFAFEHMWKRAKPLAKPASAPALPTDAELAAEVDKDPPPRPPAPPAPDFPGPKPGVAPRAVKFNGRTFDSYVFRPDKPIEPAIVEAIDAAKKSVRITLYEFDLEKILDALRRAKKRRLKVEIVVDHSHVYTTGKDPRGKNRFKQPSPQILALINEGFDILVLRGQNGGIQHNKYILLDVVEGKNGAIEEGLLVYGSYNMAETAEYNHFENIKFTTAKDKIQDYLAYFKYKRSLAKPVDHDKLDEILTRGLEAEAESEVESVEAQAAGAAGALKIPAPPPSRSKPIDLNGEKFLLNYFSPRGGVRDAWIRAIKAAKASVELAMFRFSDKLVAEALIEAQKSNPQLKVVLVLDQGQSRVGKIDGIPAGDWLIQHGLDVTFLAGPNHEGDAVYDPMFEKQHNKFMIIDRKFLLDGSFNLSAAAENNNFDNESVVVDPVDVAGFVEYFERMLAYGWKPQPANATHDAGQKPAQKSPIPGA